MKKPGTRDSSRWFRQNPRLVAGMGRASGRNEDHHDGRSDYMPGPRTRMDNHERGMELFKNAAVLGRPRASADYNYSERDKTNRRVGGSWIQISNVGSITSTAADQ